MIGHCIQFQKNRALHSEIGRSPYKIMFGTLVQTGLLLTNSPANIIMGMETEEGLLLALGPVEIDPAEVNDAEINSVEVNGAEIYGAEDVLCNSKCHFCLNCDNK